MITQICNIYLIVLTSNDLSEKKIIMTLRSMNYLT